MNDAITALQAETTTYPQNVQIWMKLMAGSFLVSIIFVYSKTGARWILAAFVLNGLGLVIGKMLFPEVSRTLIGTSVHYFAERYSRKQANERSCRPRAIPRPTTCESKSTWIGFKNRK